MHTQTAHSPSLPDVFEYTDYRKFLVECFQVKKTINPMISETAFLRQAGFGANCRGYFKLITTGKRNLSSKTILGLTNALKLQDKAAQYFENLVFFNQAKSDQDSRVYFDRLLKLAKGKKARAIELLKSQYNYFSKWYLVAIRELAALSDFTEESEWISKKLRRKVSKRQITEAIEDLITLGLLKRDDTQKLIQSHDLVNFSDNSFNFQAVNNIHHELLDLAKQSLDDDPYEFRSTSSVMLACKEEQFAEIRKDIAEFRNSIMEKYGTTADDLDTVVNLGLQLIQITPLNPKRNRRIVHV